MSPPTSSLRFRFPWALATSLVLCTGLSLATWACVRLSVNRALQHVVFVGDSTLHNARLAPGERIEDWAQRELGPKWRGHNVADVGARISDLFPQVHKAEMIVGRPDLVVLGFAGTSLVRRKNSKRFGNNGKSLRWLPLDRHGLEYYRTLSDGFEEVAIAQKLGLLFGGALDAFSSFWQEHVTYANQREDILLEEPSKRRKKVLSQGRREEQAWRQVNVGSYTDFVRSQDARDFTFLARYLRQQKLPTVIMLMPSANTGVAEQVFSEETRAKQRTMQDYVARLAAEQGIPVLNFSTPEALAAFPPSAWDDLYHLKSPTAYRYMVREVKGWLRTQQAGENHEKHHAAFL